MIRIKFDRQGDQATTARPRVQRSRALEDMDHEGSALAYMTVTYTAQGEQEDTRLVM
jgi:hypothetical protein